MPSFFETVRVIPATTGGHSARTPVIQGIRDMIAVVEYQIAHDELPMVIKNGSYVPVPVWYWKQAEGYVTTIKYGATPFKMGEGETVLAGETLRDLVDLYNRAIAAILDGQFDDQIASINQERKRRRMGGKMTDDTEEIEQYDAPVTEQPMAKPAPKKNRRR